MPTLAIPSKGFMEVTAGVRFLRLGNPFFCPLLRPSKRFLSLGICHHVGPAHVFRFTICKKNHKADRRSAILPTQKGQPTTSINELCKIIWTIEADLEDGQLLYITGDPAVLGCWKPNMAILMSPTEHANLWKAETEIASGLHFKYNYFIKEKSRSSKGILWKPGPEYSLLVPRIDREDTKIVVKDSWIRPDSNISPANDWDPWIEEIYPLQKITMSIPVKDEEKTINYLGSNTINSKTLGVEDHFYHDNEGRSATAKDSNSSSIFSDTYRPAEEPWLFDSLPYTVSKDKIKFDELKKDDTVKDEVMLVDTEKLLPEESATAKDSNSSSILNTYQPVEEPWLFYSPPYTVSKAKMKFDEFKNDDPVKDEVMLVDTEKLLPEESGSLYSKDPVSTIILINSSICTMQRIAVLEDEKLVELLLEPVNSHVRCDSVYIGVVTKLVPHMGGAFVNIGNTRPSLMDIKNGREPFIFPPFCQMTKKQEIGGSKIGSLRSSKTDSIPCDVEVFDGISAMHFENGSLQDLQNEYDEHEVEDDIDISEFRKQNVNDSLLDDGEVEADFEDYIDGSEVHLEEETSSTFLSAGINGSANSQISQVKDSKRSTHMLDVENKWTQVRKGTKIIVQVVKEGMGTKGPTLTAYPKLRSRFWVLLTRCNRIAVSKKIYGPERTRLKVIAKTLLPQGFGLIVRTVAAGHPFEELQKDLEGLLSTWKNIIEHAKSAALAADEGVEGAVPVILHTAMGQTLSVVQDYFNEKVEKMVVDSPRTYHEVTNYLQDIAPDLCNRVELYDKKVPLFDEFNIEGEIDNLLSKRVPLVNGGSLVIEQTEALVSIDVNGGHGMLGHGTSQEKATLDVNLTAAKQIARELRLRDIGGIIVVDFIDMTDEANKRLVYEEVKKAVERDRSIVNFSELSRNGLMEITRKRVRPSVTFMISEPCSCCHATGRVEALETSFSKIEQQICRLIATMDRKADPANPKSWPRFILRVDHHMCEYLTSGKKKRLATLSSSLKVWILLKVARGFTRGTFEVKPFTDDEAENNQLLPAVSVLRSSEAGAKNPGQNVTLFPVKKSKAKGK